LTAIRSRTGYFKAQPGKKSSRREETSKCDRKKKSVGKENERNEKNSIRKAITK